MSEYSDYELMSIVQSLFIKNKENGFTSTLDIRNQVSEFLGEPILLDRIRQILPKLREFLPLPYVKCGYEIHEPRFILPNGGIEQKKYLTAMEKGLKTRAAFLKVAEEDNKISTERTIRRNTLRVSWQCVPHIRSQIAAEKIKGLIKIFEE
jgi:hypothetical protein